MKKIPASYTSPYTKSGKNKGIWISKSHLNLSNRREVQTSVKSFRTNREIEAFIKILRKYGQYLNRRGK